MTSTSERVGRYQLLEPIGVGPCGSVSRAKVFGVAGFERQFAIKRFHPELTITSVLAATLSSAARAYGSLEHPRIARMSEFGVAQGTTFTAVEFVAGLDAARLGAEAKLSGEPLAAGGALALVSQAARAVGYAHGRGLTHLGLAPTNVIVTADGDVKITDFGILAAGLPQRPVDVARLQQRIQYLAPEQVANEATSAATDVFALGVIAYELVTGQRTFRGDSPQQIADAILGGPPPEPPLPRPIVRVLHRCLARSPFERFPDARALADALDAALRVAPVPGTRKDIGAQVKATMDRLEDMSANEMSGMVALNVGTGPIPRLGSQEIATLGRSDTPDPATVEFVRPDVPVPGPAPLVSPGGDLRQTMPGLAPPPQIPAPPGATLLGLPTLKSPPQIPSIKRPVSTAIPTIPRIAPPAVPAPQPRAPSAPILEHNPVGRIEIEPPPAFDAATSAKDESIETMFADEGESTSSSALALDDALDDALTVDHEDGDLHIPSAASTLPGHQPPPAPPVVGRPLARSSTTQSGFEIPTSEMSRAFVDKLREEAADPDGGSRSVQMEVVTPPEDLELVDPAVANAAFVEALTEASGVHAQPPPPTPPPTPAAPPTPPPMRARTAPSMPIPSLAAAAPTTLPPSPPPARGRTRPLWVAIILVGVAALAFGAWQLYPSETAPSTKPKVAAVVPDAAVVAPDAAVVVAVVTPDAATPIATVDAAATSDAATTIDAAAMIDAAVATVDAGTTVPTTVATTVATTPSDQLVITSAPAGARVYLDGSDVGVTPVKLAASTDRHTIALLLAGHELYIAEVDGKGSFSIPLKEVTPPGGGAGVKVIKCKAKERYYVFADGKPTGMMCPTERIVTGLGPHVIEVYDAVTETKNKWDVVITDDRLSYRIKVE